MSSKIDVKEIISGHLKTLSVAGENKLSKSDAFTFFCIPIFIAVTGIYFGFNLDKDISSLLVNFGAIFTALLLSVLVLVYDQESKLEEKKEKSIHHDLKIELLRQLYYNICYSVISSVLLVVVCFFHSALKEIRIIKDIGSSGYQISFDLGIHLLTPISVILTINLALTIIMVVKRMHVLLTTK